MLKFTLVKSSDAYMPVKGTRTVVGQRANTAAIAADRNNKKVTFKNCAPFTYCIIEINISQAHNTNVLDIVMPMYKEIEYSDNYAKTSGSLWQYLKDEADEGDITDSESFNFKPKIIKNTANASNVNVEIAVPLK